MDGEPPFRVLGPVQMVAQGQTVRLGDRKQRLVLAVLLLEPNHLVPLARMIDLLWPSSPPTSARRIVQAHLSRLRTTLASAAAQDPRLAVGVVRRGSGYTLSCDPKLIDAHRFRMLLEQARREANPVRKVALLRQALALWRGPALADVATEDVHTELCRGLDEARLSALEERTTTELRQGYAGELIDELTELASRHPFRQRFAALLMLALYHEGRAADALSVYTRFRQRLDDELGLEPPAELRQLQLAILRADPALHRDGVLPAGGLTWTEAPPPTGGMHLTADPWP